MDRPRATLPVKLICSLIGGDLDLLRRARQLLVRRFGPNDVESDPIPCCCASEYHAEMGPDLKQFLLSFERLMQPAALAEIKLQTSAIEGEFADAGIDPEITRPINIDPSYLDLGKLVVACSKDRPHRIFIGSRTYAEVALHRAADAWQAWPWTRGDYAQPASHAFLDRARSKLIDARQRIDALDGGNPTR